MTWPLELSCPTELLCSSQMQLQPGSSWEHLGCDSADPPLPSDRYTAQRLARRVQEHRGCLRGVPALQRGRKDNRWAATPINRPPRRQMSLLTATRMKTFPLTGKESLFHNLTGAENNCSLRHKILAKEIQSLGVTVSGGGTCLWMVQHFLQTLQSWGYQTAYVRSLESLLS